MRHYPEGYYWELWGNRQWTREGNRWWTIKHVLHSNDETMEDIEWYSTVA